MYRTKETVSKLWAIVDDKTNNICISRGGSSSKPRIMVYDTEAGANIALKSCWTKQVIDIKSVHIAQIYG